MYQVSIKNKGQDPIIINTVSSDLNTPKVDGKFKEGINTINQFDFTIYPDNPAYNNINPFGTLVEIANIKTNEIEFIGRVLLSIPIMGSEGTLVKNVVCESELAYLMDSSQRYGEYHNITVRGFLELIIENHNRQVTPDKHFTVGEVTVTDPNNSLYRFLDYDKTFTTIKDKLIDRLGGELRVRYENNIRYLDYLSAIGESKDIEIRLSKNLKTIEQEKDPTEIISRLVPLGAKLKDSEERLTIKSINNNKDFIDDLDAIEAFGVIEECVTWDDVEVVENLLRKGQEYLKEHNRIKKKHKVEALDLSVIGIDLESFKVGNSYLVINPLMDIHEYLRVIEKEVNINSPQTSSLTIGDKFEDIKEYQSNIAKTQRNLKQLKERVGSITNSVIDVNNALQSTNENLMNTSNSLAETNRSLVLTNEVLMNTNENLAKVQSMIIMGV